MVLIVLGLGVIASMMAIFNFANGEFVLLGAYAVHLFEKSGLPAVILAAPPDDEPLEHETDQCQHDRFYAMPIIAMLGPYAIGLPIRETMRALPNLSLWFGDFVEVAGYSTP